MAIRSTLSILGLYQYDNGIFQYFQVPEGMDKEIAKTDILSECAELEIIYSNPEVVKELIKNWVTAELPLWTKMYEAANAEFNPLYNVDAYESETIERELQGSYETAGESSGTSNNTTSVKGYNSDDWAERDKDEGSTTGESSSDGSNEETETITNTKRRYGNIGVTKSTDLIQSAWELYPILDCYKAIVQSFKNRFCIEVY